MKQSKIAITGGIGSGKSTVCKIIKQCGYPVFSCDETYKQLLNDGLLTADIVQEFGRGVLNTDGNLDRQKLSEIVFNDKNKLDRLNKITHPKIFEKMFSDAENCEKEFCFFEVPVLFEYGYENLFDMIIVIMREEEERIKSVMARDSLTRDDIILRLKRQIDYDITDFKQYYVIHNDGNFDELVVKTKELLQKVC